MAKFVVGVIVGVIVGAMTQCPVWAQPEIKGDGFLTGWRVITKQETVCFNPYVSVKEQTITCS